jgi:hypothetical protein
VLGVLVRHLPGLAPPAASVQCVRSARAQAADVQEGSVSAERFYIDAAQHCVVVLGDELEDTKRELRAARLLAEERGRTLESLRAICESYEVDLRRERARADGAELRVRLFEETVPALVADVEASFVRRVGR